MSPGFYERTAEHREQQRLAHLGNKHPLWKGDNVSYKGLHAWINRNLPKPELCQICNEKKELAAACVTGIYSREDLNNWKYICWSCHARLDGFNKDKCLGYKHTSETRQRMRLAKIGKKTGSDNPMFGMTGEKNPFYGKKHTQETKDKLRKQKLGKKFTPEHIENLRQAHLGKKYKRRST